MFFKFFNKPFLLMLLSDFLRKLGLNFYIMNNAKIKVIMIFLCNRNQNLIETALILPDIFPIVTYSAHALLHTTPYDHYFF